MDALFDVHYYILSRPSAIPFQVNSYILNYLYIASCLSERTIKSKYYEYFRVK